MTPAPSASLAPRGVMRTSRDGRTPIFGPAAIAILGLLGISLGAAVKTGFIQIRRGASAADSSKVTVRTGAGDVVMPAPLRDSSRAAVAPRPAPPPTPPELAADTIMPPSAT